MPRIGLGRWLLSWIAKPLVAIGQTFERVFDIVRAVDPTVSTSVVAGSYRNAEVALNLAPNIDSADRSAPWEIGLMTEERLGRARNYLVEFEVQVLNTETGERYLDKRLEYFMRRMSAEEYEAAYLNTAAGDPYEEGESVEGAIAVNVVHNYGLNY